MLKRFITLLIIFTGILYQPAHAQFTENFSDGDFTNNPVWTGGTDFIVNSLLQLQSNNTTSNSEFYISTINTKATEAEWYVDIDLTFSTSSANYVDVYLTSSLSDLTDINNTGYFVRIGNTSDEISLYVKNAGSTGVKIIDGADGSLGFSNNIKLKVIRTITNDWSLYRDVNAAGSILDGTVNDATYTTSAYFGLLVKQSTATFFQKHFFDNIVVQNFVPDVTPPALQSVTPLSATAADVLFSEPVEINSAQLVTNYTVNNGVGSPLSAVRDAVNIALVHLTFDTAFPNGAVNTLTASNISDLSGNVLPGGSVTFTFYIPQRFDVVIDEIMPDPNPVITLPDAEYLEIKNVSGKNINMLGWRLTSSSSSSGTFPDATLPADSFLILTSTGSTALFASYGRVLGIPSFPALGNTGTTLSLLSKEGLTIHTVSYDPSWYQNDVKKSGGWSLEMIDTKNPCTGAANWRASEDARGGSPGIKNSIDGSNPDQTGPSVIRAAVIDNLSILLTFSEALDSAKATVLANYSINNSIGTPSNAVAISPDFTKVQLSLSTPLAANIIYTITVNNVSDCSGNNVVANTAVFGLPSAIDSFDIVINEVLFNPKTDATDYVEIYNRSQKILDLKNMYIATRSATTNVLGSLTQASAESILFFPGQYYVLSGSGTIVKQNYFARNADNFIDLSLPSYSDDKGIVVLLNSVGTVVDELRYDAKWHFALLDNVEGIALERVDYNKPTQDAQNWHSAASTVGYGTPTYQNSQYRADLSIAGEVTVTPKVFSPDNDGFEDFTTINYQLADLGYVATITIFDAAGRPVKVLARNATLAQKGFFRWDGLNDKQTKVQTGTYVVYTEIFNLEGKKKHFKNAVVVASKF